MVFYYQKTIVPYVGNLNLYKDKSIFRDLGVNLKIWLVFLNQIYILMLYIRKILPDNPFDPK